MQCPDQQTQNSDKSSSPSALEVPEVANQAWDNVSQLSMPSIGAHASLSSPLRAKDHRVPSTPEGRLLKPIDEKAIDEGYDSDRLRAPWEETDPLDAEGPEQEEASLPFGSSSLVSLETPAENDAEKILSLDELRKLRVPELKNQLKSRGVYCIGKKEELIVRLRHCMKNGVTVNPNLTATSGNNLAGDSFSAGAYWEPLVCDGDIIEEDDIGDEFRAPYCPRWRGSYSKEKKLQSAV